MVQFVIPTVPKRIGRFIAAAVDRTLPVQRKMILTAMVVWFALAGCQSTSVTPTVTPSPPNIVAAAAKQLTGRQLLDERLKLNADPDWSPAECDRLREILTEVYPALVQRYGEPDLAESVTVGRGAKRGDANNQLGGEVNIPYGMTKAGDVWAQMKGLNLSVQCLEYPRVVIHELAHKFRGRAPLKLVSKPRPQGTMGSFRVDLHSGMEEGIAQAVADIIGDSLGYPRNPNQVFTVNKAFNKPAFRFSGDLAHNALYPIRLWTAAYAFTDWESKDPGFLKRLNNALYQLPESKLPPTRATFLAVAEQVSPGVKTYFIGQEIFNLKPQPGYHLFVVGDNQRIGLGLIEVHADGIRERPVANHTLTSPRGSATVRCVTDKEGIYSMKLDSTPNRYVAKVKWRNMEDTFYYP